MSLSSHCYFISRQTTRLIILLITVVKVGFLENVINFVLGEYPCFVSWLLHLEGEDSFWW